MGSHTSNTGRPREPAAGLSHPQQTSPQRPGRSRQRLNADELEQAHRIRVELIYRPLACMNRQTFAGKSWAGILIPRELDLIEELAMEQMGKGYAGYFDYSGPELSEGIDE